MLGVQNTPGLHSQAGEDFKVSVCIPTYNAEKTLAECLESVFNQGVKLFEVLIVDGYSKDSTLKIGGKYPEVRVVGYAKGIGKARKMLAEHATGDIIAWVDADVTVPPNWLKPQLKIHRENKEIMIVTGRWLRGSLTQMACTMKKQLFATINYDEHFRVGEEWDFMLSAQQEGVKRAYYDGAVFHDTRQRARRSRLRFMIYGGNYILFLRKHGVWYIKSDPKHFVAFLFRIAMVYALPLSLLLSPFALLVYPAAWLARSVMYKTLTHPFTLLVEVIKGFGEHLYLLKIL